MDIDARGIFIVGRRSLQTALAAPPGGRAMTIEFHLLDAMDEIPALLRNDVMCELEAANEQIAQHIRLDRLDIVVAPEPWVLREWGLSG